jgi:hypothetical protein
VAAPQVKLAGNVTVLLLAEAMGNTAVKEKSINAKTRLIRGYFIATKSFKEG